MCAIGALANAGDTPPPRNNVNATVKPWVPNCVRGPMFQREMRIAAQHMMRYYHDDGG